MYELVDGYGSIPVNCPHYHYNTTRGVMFVEYDKRTIP